MKKIVLSVVAIAMSMVAMATETAYVQIQLTGVNGGISNSVYLIEDDAYTSAYESGADAEKMMSQSNVNSVLMYGFVGTTPCGDIVTNNLDGVKLGLKTNQVDVNYTLKFKNASGRRTTSICDGRKQCKSCIYQGGEINKRILPIFEKFLLLLHYERKNK